MRLKNPQIPAEWMLALRVGAGLAAFALGLAGVLSERGGDPSMLGGIGMVLAASLCFMIAAIFLAGPMAAFLAQPFGNLFFPADEYDRPQPLYSLAEAQARRSEFETAMTTYEGIAESFPGEIQPWLGMIEIAVQSLNDMDRAQRIFERGVAALPTPEAKETLAVMFRGIRSRRAEKPEWGQEKTIAYRHHPRG